MEMRKSMLLGVYLDNLLINCPFPLFINKIIESPCSKLNKLFTSSNVIFLYKSFKNGSF